MTTMTREETNKLVKKMESFAKKINSPIKAKDALVKAGICTPSGKLKEAYK